jgi:hypothetical protein
MSARLEKTFAAEFPFDIPASDSARISGSTTGLIAGSLL